VPFVSKKQQRKCYAMKAKGEAGSWDCKEFARHTDFAHLPEKKAGPRGITWGRALCPLLAMPPGRTRNIFGEFIFKTPTLTQSAQTAGYDADVLKQMTEQAKQRQAEQGPAAPAPGDHLNQLPAGHPWATGGQPLFLGAAAQMPAPPIPKEAHTLLSPAQGRPHVDNGLARPTPIVVQNTDEIRDAFLSFCQDRGLSKEAAVDHWQKVAVHLPDNSPLSSEIPNAATPPAAKSMPSPAQAQPPATPPVATPHQLPSTPPLTVGVPSTPYTFDPSRQPMLPPKSPGDDQAMASVNARRAEIQQRMSQPEVVQAQAVQEATRSTQRAEQAAAHQQYLRQQWPEYAEGGSQAGQMRPEAPLQSSNSDMALLAGMAPRMAAPLATAMASRAAPAAAEAVTPAVAEAATPAAGLSSRLLSGVQRAAAGVFDPLPEIGRGIGAAANRFLPSAVPQTVGPVAKPLWQAASNVLRYPTGQAAIGNALRGSGGLAQTAGSVAAPMLSAAMGERPPDLSTGLKAMGTAYAAPLRAVQDLTGLQTEKLPYVGHKTEEGNWTTAGGAPIKHPGLLGIYEQPLQDIQHFGRGVVNKAAPVLEREGLLGAAGEAAKETGRRLAVGGQVGLSGVDDIVNGDPTMSGARQTAARIKLQEAIDKLPPGARLGDLARSVYDKARSISAPKLPENPIQQVAQTVGQAMGQLDPRNIGERLGMAPKFEGAALAETPGVAGTPLAEQLKQITPEAYAQLNPAQKQQLAQQVSAQTQQYKGQLDSYAQSTTDRLKPLADPKFDISQASPEQRTQLANDFNQAKALGEEYGKMAWADWHAQTGGTPKQFSALLKQPEFQERGAQVLSQHLMQQGLSAPQAEQSVLGVWDQLPTQFKAMMAIGLPVMLAGLLFGGGGAGASSGAGSLLALLGSLALGYGGYKAYQAYQKPADPTAAVAGQAEQVPLEHVRDLPQVQAILSGQNKDPQAVARFLTMLPERDRAQLAQSHPQLQAASGAQLPSGADAEMMRGAADAARQQGHTDLFDAYGNPNEKAIGAIIGNPENVGKVTSYVRALTPQQAQWMYNKMQPKAWMIRQTTAGGRMMQELEARMRG
jgi:hypothetical protein